MSLEYFITDIDNTIADTTKRLRRSLRELGREEVFAKTSDRFGGFAEYLDSEELDKFWKLFLSGEFLHLDEPAPESARILQKMIDKGVKLIYLTGRHDQSGDTMRPGTERWLEENEFPVPDGSGTKLFMKPRRNMEDKEFKLALLKDQLSGKLTSERAVGVGDHPDDALIYKRAGIKPVLVSWIGLFSSEELNNSVSGVTVVKSWLEIEEEMCFQLDK
ncbi:HAD family hydrolase [Candidatus Bipolaricaulota bacterium]|nr:HAD family hydrolase [Candidatus Bipolaricaulota bacterium]